MWYFKSFIFGCLVFGSEVGCKGSNIYEDYSLVRLIPKNEKELEALRNFSDPDGEIEIFKRSRDIADTLDALVPSNKTGYIELFARKHGVNYEVKENYGRSLETDELSPQRRMQRGYNPYGYNSWQIIAEYINGLEVSHPGLVKLQTLGKSYQGREMKLVKISRDPDAKNPIIFIDAGIHAREWVAPAMALYLIHRLTNDPSAFENELKGIDWYILPVVNPDGYEYSRTSSSNRLWRKTRSKQQNCFGVDGNRNYGYRWGVSGVSNDPCNQERYAGPKPFSEVETRMVRNVMMENAKRLKLYVSLHAYGQYLVYPWGYTGDYLPKEWKNLDTLARKVSGAVVKAGGKPFKVLSAGKWYPAAGASDDFAFGAVGVPYSYTMELTDGFDFVYPEHNLRTVLLQFHEGFKVFGENIRAEFG